MKFFSKKRKSGYIRPEEATSYKKWWDERWNDLDFKAFYSLGFMLPEKFTSLICNKKEIPVKDTKIYIDHISLWPLDEENFKETSKLTGFLSITIGTSHGGSYAVIPLNGPSDTILIMDDRGAGDQICAIVAYEVFFDLLK